MRPVIGAAHRRAGPSLAVRGALLIVMSGFSLGIPAVIWHAVAKAGDDADSRGMIEACLAVALAAQLEVADYPSESLANGLRQLSDRSADLEWAGILTVDGEALEFTQQSGFPVDLIRRQVDFSRREMTTAPLSIAGVPSSKLRLITIPQPGGDAVLAAILNAGTPGLTALDLMPLMIGAAIIGLMLSFLWLQYGVLRPIQRSAESLRRWRDDLADAGERDLPPLELQELARTVADTSQELNEWKSKAQVLRETLDQRISARTRDLTRAQRRAEREADTDALTGLSNRRVLERTLPEMFAEQRKQGGELTLALFDINHFKDCNDALGHQTGDELLGFVGDLVRMCTRKNRDVGIRIGGDEFVLLLPTTSSVAAVSLLERLSAMFAQHARKLSAPTPPTLSAGVVSMRAHNAQSPEHLLNMADEMMYRAKRKKCAVLTFPSGGRAHQPAR